MGRALKSRLRIRIEGLAGTVIVSRRGEGKFPGDRRGRTRCADEPESWGLIQARPLTSCWRAGVHPMTVRLYAEHKKLRSARHSAPARQDYAADCETARPRTARSTVSIACSSLEGALDDAQRKLLEIADKCPAHRTLHSEVSVKTRWPSRPFSAPPPPSLVLRAVERGSRRISCRPPSPTSRERDARAARPRHLAPAGLVGLRCAARDRRAFRYPRPAAAMTLVPLI